MITGDGRRLELGGRVVKNVAGFDLLKLMVGWVGDVWRHHPGHGGALTQYPTRDITLVYEADSLETLLAVGRALATAPIVPAALRLDLLGDTAQVAARVVGGEFSAPAEADILEKAAAHLASPASIQTADASRAVWVEQQQAPVVGTTELSLIRKAFSTPGDAGSTRSREEHRVEGAL